MFDSFFKVVNFKDVNNEFFSIIIINKIAKLFRIIKM